MPYTKADKANIALSFVAPKTARRIWDLRKRKYAAAKTAVSTGGWSPNDQGVNDEIGGSKAQINNRVRQLVRDMPHAAIAVDRVVDFTVGEGFKLQARTRLPDGKLNMVLNKQIEEAWEFWKMEADISGKLSFDEMTRLAKRQDVEIGEFLTLKTSSRKSGRFIPFALQILEADSISNVGANPQTGNQVSYGVEYNANTAEPEAYWIGDNYSNSTRVTADKVIHGFKSLRPNQLRGVSAFAPAVLLSHSFRDYIGSELAAAQMASKWLAFITSTNADNMQNALGAATDSEFDRKVQDVYPAQIEYLQQGESIEFAENQRGTNFGPFTEFTLRTTSAVLGISYELVSNDYSGLNYTTLRGIRNDMVKSLKPQGKRHLEQFVIPAYYLFLDWAVITGRLKIPGYFSNPWAFRQASWIAPGLESVDPLREAKADIDLIKNNLKSPQEVIMRRGQDPDTVITDNVEWQRKTEEAGLITEETSTAAQTNPAALGAEEEDDNGN